MTKSRLFLVMHLIGREDDVRFLDQSQSKVLKNQSDPGLILILN